MKVISVNSLSEVPKTQMRVYSLSATYTEQTATEAYVKRFGSEPQQAWRYQNLLYIELPEKETK